MVEKKSDIKEREFVFELIKYLKGSITGTAESVKTLANIEENYKEEYKMFRDSKLDPSKIDTILETIEPEKRDTLFLIFAKSAYIGQRLNKLFELSLDEKKELAETISKFAVFVDEQLSKLNKKK